MNATHETHIPPAWTVHESPMGPLTLCGGRAGLSALHFPGHAGERDEARHDPTVFADAIGQLEEYFAGRRTRFELALDLGGTPFQRAVWERLLRIPYATTVTYGALAEAIGRPDRVRAAAAAVGRTPVPIIVPCHRVIAAGGALTGYRGGLWRKRALLELERSGRQPEAAGTSRQLALL